MDSKLAWLREALEMENYSDTTREFVENIRKDFFSDYVYVLTPQGRIIDLVTGSTPLDFAYRIHSNVGNQTQHAKVNGAIVRLDYKLKNNDVVEIITSPNASPSRDWLKIVKTQQAKAKIRQWFKKANRAENVQRGKEMIAESLKRRLYLCGGGKKRIFCGAAQAVQHERAGGHLCGRRLRGRDHRPGDPQAIGAGAQGTAGGRPAGTAGKHGGRGRPGAGKIQPQRRGHRPGERGYGGALCPLL